MKYDYTSTTRQTKYQKKIKSKNLRRVIINISHESTDKIANIKRTCEMLVSRELKKLKEGIMNFNELLDYYKINAVESRNGIYAVLPDGQIIELRPKKNTMDEEIGRYFAVWPAGQWQNADIEPEYIEE